MKAICLWSGPRNVSTALMYSFAQRSDTRVVDEPLYGHFLRVTGTVHPGRDEIMAAVNCDGDAVMRELRASFRPEFLNRVDDIVLFKPLHLDEIKQIVGLLAAQLGERLKDREIGLEISPEAQDFIAREGYDPVYGARPLKRYMQRELETKIGRALVAGDVLDGATVRVGLSGGELSIDTENPSPAEERPGDEHPGDEAISA